MTPQEAAITFYCLVIFILGFWSGWTERGWKK